MKELSLSRVVVPLSGDHASSARAQCGSGTTPNMREEHTLLDWIPVDNRLCAFRLDDSVRTNDSRLKHRCMFPVYVYAPNFPVPARQRWISTESYLNVTS